MSHQEYHELIEGLDEKLYNAIKGNSKHAEEFFEDDKPWLGKVFLEQAAGNLLSISTKEIKISALMEIAYAYNSHRDTAIKAGFNFG